MKSTFLLILLWLLYLPLFCQEVIQGPWRLECGTSTNTVFKKPSCVNLRYVSPRFNYSVDDWTEEMEKHPEKFKRARFMLELIYSPPFKMFCTGLNLQYRLLKYKKLSMEVYGGLKFFLVGSSDLITNPIVMSVANKQGWYMNTGLLFQLNLDVIAPFFDLGYDGIITVGTELNFHVLYRNPKKRYKLHTRKVDE